MVRHGNAWLDLIRNGPQIVWRREDGRRGMLMLTDSGRVRGDAGEEEMDMVAEEWARELMQ